MFYMNVAVVILLAVLLDRLLGEPRRWHPLSGFGSLGQAVEDLLNRPTPSSHWRLRLRGLFALLLLIVPFVGIAYLASRLPLLGTATALALLYLALGYRSLVEHAERVISPLGSGELDMARRQVGRLVSRDTAVMQEADIARATTESVLENGNDAVFATLFWFAVAGAPGVVLYRLVNTLDAMWGYRTPRFRHFGWAAARLDDLLNFIPARLTALSYALCGELPAALRCWRQQGRLWESPNAGPVMAAGAGALGVQIGGADWYHGALKQRPLLGTGRPAQSTDIRRALELLHRSLWLWLACITCGGWLYA